MAYNYTQTAEWFEKTCRREGLTPAQHLRRYGANYPQAEINTIAASLSEQEKEEIVARYETEASRQEQLAEQSTSLEWKPYHTSQAQGMREVAERWKKTLAPQTYAAPAPQTPGLRDAYPPAK